MLASLTTKILAVLDSAIEPITRAELTACVGADVRQTLRALVIAGKVRQIDYLVASRDQYGAHRALVTIKYCATKRAA